MEHRHFEGMRALLAFSWRFRHLWRQAVAAVACGALASALQLLVPLSSVIIINRALPERDGRLLALIAAGLAVTTGLSMLAGYAQLSLSAAVRERMSLELQRDVLDHVLRLPLRFFRTHDDGYLMSRILGDSEQAIEFPAGLTSLGRSLVWFLTATILVPGFHPILGAIVIAVLPLYALVLAVANGKVRRQFNLVQERSALSSRELHQALSGVVETKAYCAEKFRTRRYVSALVERARCLVRGRQLMALGQSSTQVIVLLVSLFILGFGGAEVMRGRLSLGGLVALNALAGYLLAPVSEAVQRAFQAQKSLAAIERLQEVLGVDMERGGRPWRGPVRGHVALDDVHFAYGPEKPVLQGVSLEIQPGETVLLLGSSGAGKTTLVGLLPRFFEPLEGRIRIDGQDVAELDLRDLRRRIAFVSQDTFLFSDTIYRNILLGRPSASPAEVLRAARLSNVLEFAETLPQGLETPVGERGCRLSGGQRQRISMARALLKDASLLILDEASSAVDARTEVALHEALAGLMDGRTTLIIAHHATAFLDRVDRTLVLEDGRVREVTPHAARKLLHAVA